MRESSGDYRRRLVTVVLAVSCVCLLVSRGAMAAPTISISAEAVCATGDGTIAINYTVSADVLAGLDPNLARNDVVNILLNGVIVDTGAFVAPDYAFSGSTTAPASAGPGDAISVTAHAVGQWDPNSLAGGPFTGGQSTSVAVTIPTDPCTQPGLGRFTGGGHQIRVDGVRVTRGLTIHCDLLLSNNLEVNWGGDHFHMTEHLTTVACTDDPLIIQAPPDAPLDTLVGVGTGRYNNQDGYTIEFTLVDGGEPGRNDMMRIYIYETTNPGNIVLDVPLQLLDGGNLQAHADQPHR